MNKDQRWTRALIERDSWMCQNCGTTKHLEITQNTYRLETLPSYCAFY